jgi:alkylhydroperoxidase family enzyme
MKFDIEQLKSAIEEMNINAAVDCERYESKEAYLEWLEDYIEYEIVQPLEREAAAVAGVDEYNCDQCENNDEARDIVNEVISNVKSDLF